MEKSSKSSSADSAKTKRKTVRPRAKATAPKSRSKAAKVSQGTDELPFAAPPAPVVESVSPVREAALPPPVSEKPRPAPLPETNEPEAPRAVFVPTPRRVPEPAPAPTPPPDESPSVPAPAPQAVEPREPPVQTPAREESSPALDQTTVEETGARPVEGTTDDARRDTPPVSGSQDHGGRPQGGFPNREFRGRDYWKQLKKDKRNKHGKPWQAGGNEGGHGGGRGPQHPPQPPPPTFAPKLGDLPDPARFADLPALDALAASLDQGSGEVIWLDELYALNLADLTAFARRMGCALEGQIPRRQIVSEIFNAAVNQRRPLRDRGYLDVTDRGHGFVVHEHVNYRLYPEDAYVAESLIKRFGLKRGHQLEVVVQAPVGDDRCPAVLRVDRVMQGSPESANAVTPFEELVPYYPLQRILLEAPDVQKDISMRTVDLLTPIGFGQRGLIVAPPRTGKTVLLQNIANSISANFPDVKLILLLIDERPEEVTDFRRHTKGEVVSSTFDETPESHVHCAEMVGEKARRLVERGQHVVILLDSITRLARAYNALASNSGKIMSGGMEATALQRPKRFFGAARNIEGGGSLTILASALIDTGSRMDEVIFEEFKGTGNMELHLDRGLSDKRIFPAINMLRSGTRKEELIYHPDELQRIYGLRRTMQGIGPIESMEMLIQRLKKTKSNAEFLMSLAR
ncbi:MAG: transcription termination factor Rho [Opitutaceae bacterium]|nr:transcription termination factor Rho [Opitutaceae bacterium]